MWEWLYINGDLKEEIYMKQFESFVINGQVHMVCILKKNLFMDLSKHLDNGISNLVR